MYSYLTARQVDKLLEQREEEAQKGRRRQLKYEKDADEDSDDAIQRKQDKLEAKMAQVLEDSDDSDKWIQKKKMKEEVKNQPVEEDIKSKLKSEISEHYGMARKSKKSQH